MSGALEQHHGPEPLGTARGGLEAVRGHPVGVGAEQPRELARVRREHRRRVPLDRLEPEEAVRVDDRGERRSLEERPDDAAGIVAASEPRADRQRVGALEIGGEIVEHAVVGERALHRLERQRLDDREGCRRHGERDVTGVGPQRRGRREHRGAGRPGRPADDEERTGRELRVAAPRAAARA